MFQFLGYDFLGGINALRGSSAMPSNLKKVELTNAIYDHFNVTRDTDRYADREIPLEWTKSTIMNADFNNNINAGNIGFLLDQITEIRIKRRRRGEFKWVTLKTIKIEIESDLTFAFEDYLNAFDVEYEYALVPVVEGIEGEYNIERILSKFTGVIIADAEESYKIIYEVGYQSNARNQQTGVFTPLGRQYPIVVANGNLSYESGTLTATALNDDYEETGRIDRIAITKKKNKIKDFLTNKKPKIIKDWNQNIWLVMIVDNVQMNYKTGSGMSIPQLTCNWVEIGDANNEDDLVEAGFVEGENKDVS